jgi:hypothetical protein
LSRSHAHASRACRSAPGEPIGLNWHKLSFVNNALQVWFGATKELHERGEKRSIGILTLVLPSSFSA